LDVTGEVKPNNIVLSVTGARVRDPNGEAAPILIANTFHPNWHRSDGHPIYAVTPFYMLTFADGPAAVDLVRRIPDKLSLWVSAATVVGLFSFLFLSLRHKHIPRKH